MATQKKKQSRRAVVPDVVGVIPARFGSTRLPGKSLLKICGKPLICRVVENALKARKLDVLIVATDDRRIADAVRGMAVEVVMTRPDHPTGTDRIAEATAGLKAEIIINIQGDEPLIDPSLVDTLAIKMRENPLLDMATAAAPLKDMDEVRKSSVVKVVCDGSGRALYFSRSVIPSIRDNDVPGELIYRRHIGIYAYRKAFLERLVTAPQALMEKAEKLEQLRALYLGANMAVVDAAECASGVDTPEDVEKVERELKRRGES
jgi:3-deoxy-manno-octulosonate cytidylyltransferase (CMP-KDO synthetase)